ncbi:V-type ATP synthase subunit E family protein [Saccharicrinis fermentans]|uniref:V-type ATP synthase subunit E n=1 Tax=Saccharicrinis fermentans DSM 9555 = JCM 21142 TaxID=869213 RepID=W7YJL2_9BACT|nr:V-type ATP synthase subunit E family protein [Saccharicrinis fermentans]GAF04716.1 V-type ATP synthase subunit E [Saccharicrinis fermentans DSM 9555 = JCM 21142]
MQSKLQELTDKLYSEGVQKANEEAESIIEKARQEAEKIVGEAQQTASAKIEEAERKAAETQRNIEAEIKLASQQAISTLRQKIGKSITAAVAEPTLNEVFSDKKYVQSLITKLVEGWTKTGNFDINIVLPDADKAELDEKITKSFAAEINKGLSFKFDSAVKSGFKVGPSDGSYVISFTEEDFKNFFMSFLRPKTNQLLFED